MSTLIGKRPISVVIFDRTQAGLSDVPVFAQKLKEKVNTPSPEEKITSSLSPQALRIVEAIHSEKPGSVLRADSSGGQTGEFAQSTDPVRSSDSVHRNDTSNQLRIDPVVISSIVDDPMLTPIEPVLIGLDQVLKELATLKPVIPAIEVSPMEGIRLDAVHTHGYLERVTLPPREKSVRDVIELLQFATRRYGQKLAKNVHAAQKNLTEVAASTRTRVNTLLGTLGSYAYQASSTLVTQAQTLHIPTLPRIEVTVPRLNNLVTIPSGERLKTNVSMKLQSLFGFTQESFISITSKLFIVLAIVLMLLTVGPMVALEFQSIQHKISRAFSGFSTRAEEPENLAMETKPTPVPSANPDPEKQFQIQIPRIGVDSKVIANVDPGSEEKYTEALKKGVAHAAGTGLPGESNTENKTIFIFGHSTNGEWNISRYNALFYSLKDLVVGDTFTVWFWGREFGYTITETRIVEANDVSFLVPQTDKDLLILQTCWPPGTSWKRFLVVAEPVK